MTRRNGDKFLNSSDEHRDTILELRNLDWRARELAEERTRVPRQSRRRSRRHGSTWCVRPERVLLRSPLRTHHKLCGASQAETCTTTAPTLGSREDPSVQLPVLPARRRDASIKTRLWSVMMTTTLSGNKVNPSSASGVKKFPMWALRVETTQSPALGHWGPLDLSHCQLLPSNVDQAVTSSGMLCIRLGKVKGADVPHGRS